MSILLFVFLFLLLTIWSPIMIPILIVGFCLFLSTNSNKKNEKKNFKFVGPDSNMTLDQIIVRLGTVKNTKTTLIITDPKIVENNENRKQIHEECNNLGISSKKISPSGAAGVFMVIEPVSKIIIDGLTQEDLELFVRMTSLPIEKKLLKSKKAFKYKMNVLTEFWSSHGNKTATPHSPWELYEMFLDMKQYSKDQSLISYTTLVRNQIIDHIKQKDGYLQFTKSDMKKTIVPKSESGDMHNCNPFKIGVQEFWGISIDIRKANFTVLKLCDPSIFDEQQCWTDFVKQFTPSEFILNSKMFRQETFGNLNIKKILSKQMDLLRTLAGKLQNAQIYIDGNINSDELIIGTSKEEIPALYERIMEIIHNEENPEIWRVDVFRTQPLLPYPITAFCPFVKQIYPVINYGEHWWDNYWTEFCCTPKVYMTQVMKFWQGQEIEEGDLLFGDEYGNIQTFSSPLF